MTVSTIFDIIACDSIPTTMPQYQALEHDGSTAPSWLQYYHYYNGSYYTSSNSSSAQVFTVSVLRQHRRIVCFEGSHSVAFMLALINVFIYAIAFPIITLVCLKTCIIPRLLRLAKVPSELLQRELCHCGFAGVPLQATMSEYAGAVSGRALADKTAAALRSALDGAASGSPPAASTGLDFRVSTYSEHDVLAATSPQCCAACCRKQPLETAPTLQSIVEQARTAANGEQAHKLPLQPTAKAVAASKSVFLADGTAVWTKRVEGGDAQQDQFLFEAVEKVALPMCGVNCCCLRSRPTKVKLPADILDSSVGLNPDIVSGVSPHLLDQLLSPSHRCPPAEPIMSGGNYRPSLFQFAHVNWFLLFFTSFTAFLLPNSGSAATAPPVQMIRGIVLSTLYVSVAFCLYWFSPYRALKIWVQPLHISNLLLSALASLHIAIGAYSESQSAMNVASGIAYLLAILCLALCPVILISFLGTLFVGTGADMRSMALFARARSMAAQQELKRLSHIFPQLSPAALSAAIARMRLNQTLAVHPPKCSCTGCWRWLTAPGDIADSVLQEVAGGFGERADINHISHVNPMLAAAPNDDAFASVADELIELVDAQAEAHPSGDPLAAVEAAVASGLDELATSIAGPSALSITATVNPLGSSALTAVEIATASTDPTSSQDPQPPRRRVTLSDVGSRRQLTSQHHSTRVRIGFALNGASRSKRPSVRWRRVITEQNQP